jgi:endonuclease/exonuclease/phosphatase family metal-dependent hydrolase
MQFIRARKRALLWCLAGFAAVVLLALIGAACVSLLTRGERSEARPVQTIGKPLGSKKDVLSVMTLNLAHGRSDGPNQFFCSTKTIRANLKAIEEMLRRERPDVVALQEADGPSFWSGGFDHVGALAEGAACHSFVRAENVRGLGLSYGTAIISAHAARDARAFTFKPNWPTFSKGFIVATLDWPGRPGTSIDVVSVHLDFSSRAARRSQVEELIEALKGRPNPLVVMGDFNCGWTDPDSPLRFLAEGLDLHTWKPEDRLVTFPESGARIDWILISRDLEFRSHRVLPDVLSDHLPVVAEIRLR